VAAHAGNADGLPQRWDANSRLGRRRLRFGHSGGDVNASLDFSSYISDEILSALTPAERRFLTDASVLEAITLRGATALWRAGKQLNLASGGDQASSGNYRGGRTIVLHPCLREFLRERLAVTDRSASANLQHTYARLLLDEGLDEDAVELLIQLNMLDEAAAGRGACLREPDPTWRRGNDAAMDRCSWRLSRRRQRQAHCNAGARAAWRPPISRGQVANAASRTVWGGWPRSSLPIPELSPMSAGRCNGNPKRRCV